MVPTTQRGAKRSSALQAPSNPRRDSILDAAFTVMMERGYDRTSTLDIASAAKVSKRELYALFDNKQEILTACIAARAARMRRSLTLPAPEDGPTFLGVLTDFASTFLREMCSPAVVAVYRLAAIDAQRSPEVAQALDTVGRDASREALIGLLKHAQSRGFIGAGDPSPIASEFFSLLVGDLLLRLVLRVTEPPSAREIDRRVRAAVDALLRLHPTAAR